FEFPSPEHVQDDIIAYGGNLSPGMLLSAYRQGIFPWYGEKDPLLWWSPNPRFILMPNELHIPGSLKRIIRQKSFTFTMNKCFENIITECAHTKRPGQSGTWIFDEVIKAYIELHRFGYAHSFEAWTLEANGNTKLAGGFYGVLLGQVFFGESMFSRVPNASKSAFVTFVKNFRNCGGQLIDSQIYTDHIARFGGKNISRDAFLHLESMYLNSSLTKNLQSCY
ncbi:MAG: leucyl/phenylalanyl-tRNA--protein transferase, partial [Spirochaetales bacterium]